MFTLPPLLQSGYWFSLTPIPFLPWAGWLVFGMMSLLLIVGIGLWWMGYGGRFSKERRRIYRRWSSVGIWSGLAGLLIYSFTWLRIPVLSIRALFLVWMIGFGYWAWTIFRHIAYVQPIMDKQKAERAAYEKWLPKPKQHR